MAETEDYKVIAEPEAHKASHQDEGSDEVNVAGLSGELTDEQKSAWTKVSGKPATFPPEDHAARHAAGGADPLTDVLRKDGSVALTADWDIGSDRKIKADIIRARDAQGIGLKDDGGNGLFVNDGGIIDMRKQSCCRVHLSTTQSIPPATLTKVTFQTVDWDYQNEYDEVTNYRFTAIKAGPYLVATSIAFDVLAAGKYMSIQIWRDGVRVTLGVRHWTGGTGACAQCMPDLIYFTAGQFIQAYTYHNDTVSRNLSVGNGLNYMSIIKVA